jgi:rod shape-determining protein MreC
MLALHRRTSYLFLAIVLGHVLLISAQVQSRSGVPMLQAVAFAAFAKVQQVLAATADGGRSLWSNYFALRGVARENEALKQRTLELEGQLQQAQALAGQTRALEETLGLRQSMPKPTVAARVIAGDPTPGSLTTITIDRGADDGVQPDFVVIGRSGVVGRVINRPLPHVAQVQLLVGRNAAAAAMLERTGAAGMVAVGGSGDPPIRLELVPSAADVKPGDRLLTSGQDGLYPRGFAIGTIEKAEHRAGQWVISVRPAVDFSHLDVVLVILEKATLPPPGRGGS